MREQAKVGTVTLLFTDLVGSTEILEQLGDDAADDLRRIHFNLLRATVQDFGGQEVKNLGDGLMVVFASAADAIGCAIGMQQSVRDHNEAHPEQPIHVRIGLHVGDALREEDDYFGRPVVIAKRLCDSATGGQILVSELVRNLVGSRGSFAFRDLGWLALKGIATPVPAQEVVWEPVDRRELLEQRARESRAAEGPAVPATRRMYLRVVAAGLVAAAVVAGVFALRSGDEEDASRPVTRLGELEWRRIDVSDATFGGPGDQVINRIASARPGLIAVGSDGSSDEADAAVWESRDGTAWTRVRTDQTAFGGPGVQTIWGIKPFKRGLVAVGLDGAGGDLDAAVWISDGVAWKRVRHDESVFGGSGHQIMNRVIAGGRGVVAIGLDSSGDDVDAAAWTSKDGRSWVRYFPDESVFGGPNVQTMRSVATYGGDRLVAVGHDASGGDHDAAVWTSDGFAWNLIPHDEGVFGGPQKQQMLTVIAGDFGAMAVGVDARGGDEDAAVWTSPDAIDWERAPASLEVFGGADTQEILGVDYVPGTGFVAVGRDDSGGDPDGIVWTSSDGRDWIRVEPPSSPFGGPGEQTMKWVLGTPERFVAGGWDGSGGDLDAAVWVGEIP